MMTVLSTTCCSLCLCNLKRCLRGAPLNDPHHSSNTDQTCHNVLYKLLDFFLSSCQWNLIFHKIFTASSILLFSVIQKADAASSMFFSEISFDCFFFQNLKFALNFVEINISITRSNKYSNQ